MSIEDTVRADVSLGPDLDAAAVRNDDDAIGNRDSSRDQNPPSEFVAIRVHLDFRAPSNVGGPIDLDP